MSAYIVNPEHVGALAAYALRQRYPSIVSTLQGKDKKETAQNVARCLIEQNIRSVAERYPNDKDGERPGPCGYTDAKLVSESAACAAAYLISPPRLKAIDIIRMARGYDYQACETDDYATTVAYQQLQHIIGAAIRDLPGYDNAVRDFHDDRFSKVAA